MAAYEGQKKNLTEEEGAGAGAGGGGPGGGDEDNAKLKGGASLSSLKDCANCSAPEGTIPGKPHHRHCSRCKNTYYCSRACQKVHWFKGGHKKLCVPVADQRVPSGGTTGEEENQSKAPSAERGFRGGTGSGTGEAADEAVCAICLEVLREASSEQLPCSHVYHAECVKHLRKFGINQVCPLCRADLPPGPEQLWDKAARRWMVLMSRYGQGEFEPWIKISDEKDRLELDAILRFMKDAAEQGCVEAQGHLGEVYDHSLGVPRDANRAVRYMRMAAENGNATAALTAQNNLGYAYQQGKGDLPQSYVKAVEWWRKAADQGYAPCQHNLGVAYIMGKGVAQSDHKAAEFYRKAAEQCHAGAQVGLAELYYFGRGGLPRDLKLSLKYLKHAAAQGREDAKLRMPQVLGAIRMEEFQRRMLSSNK